MFRQASNDDVGDLARLERDANLAGLSHVFPPDKYPFPFDDVLARWQLVFEDPTAVVLVQERPDGSGLAAYAAYDDESLRHLAVHPKHWGEQLATTAVGLALQGMARRGTTTAYLWVLEENFRARRLYAHLGWSANGEGREAPWPPHPWELRYSRPVPAAG